LLRSGRTFDRHFLQQSDTSRLDRAVVAWQRPTEPVEVTHVIAVYAVVLDLRVLGGHKLHVPLLDRQTPAALHERKSVNRALISTGREAGDAGTVQATGEVRGEDAAVGWQALAHRAFKDDAELGGAPRSVPINVALPRTDQSSGQPQSVPFIVFLRTSELISKRWHHITECRSAVPPSRFLLAIAPEASRSRHRMLTGEL